MAFDQYNCIPIHLFISFNTIHTANVHVHRALLTSTKCTMRSEKQYMHLSLLDPPLPKKPPKNQKAKTTINAYVKILQLIWQCCYLLWIWRLRYIIISFESQINYEVYTIYFLIHYDLLHVNTMYRYGVDSYTILMKIHAHFFGTNMIYSNWCM